MHRGGHARLPGPSTADSASVVMGVRHSPMPAPSSAKFHQIAPIPVPVAEAEQPERGQAAASTSPASMRPAPPNRPTSRPDRAAASAKATPMARRPRPPRRGGVALDLLEVRAEVDDRPDEREEHDQRGEVGGGERRAGEQRDVDQRPARPALPGHQGGQGGEAGRERGEHHRGAPAEVVPSMMAKASERHPGGRSRRPRPSRTGRRRERAAGGGGARRPARPGSRRAGR